MKMYSATVIRMDRKTPTKYLDKTVTLSIANVM